MSRQIQLGPIKIITERYYCKGCRALKLEEWSFMGENDDLDSGTSAICTLANKPISSYWLSHDPTPSWCPMLEDRKVSK